MTRTLFTEDELRLATESRLKCIWAANFSISQIQLDPSLLQDLYPEINIPRSGTSDGISRLTWETQSQETDKEAIYYLDDI
ncbi:hypothetical protein N7504_005870 [Penicillium tannophilum]|nr:hypothetical protein N7504_005870 [Penicillium tannophilum]